MTSAQTNRNERERAGGSPVPTALEDRIAADGEQVLHTLEPNRTPETVRHPDPKAPQHDPNVTAPQTNADVQMARRTDAGPQEVTRTGPALSARGSELLLWVAGIAGLFLVVMALIWLT